MWQGLTHEITYLIFFPVMGLLSTQVSAAELSNEQVCLIKHQEILLIRAQTPPPQSTWANLISTELKIPLDDVNSVLNRSGTNYSKGENAATFLFAYNSVNCAHFDPNQPQNKYSQFDENIPGPHKVGPAPRTTASTTQDGTAGSAH